MLVVCVVVVTTGMGVCQDAGRVGDELVAAAGGAEVVGVPLVGGGGGGVCGVDGHAADRVDYWRQLFGWFVFVADLDDRFDGSRLDGRRPGCPPAA